MRVFLAAWLTLLAGVSSAQSLPELFVHGRDRALSADVPGIGGDGVVSRTRVGLRLEPLFAGGGAAGIVLNAGSERWIARFERLEYDRIGFRSWIGRIEGLIDSHVVITERDGVVSGLIDAVGITYQLRTERPGAYLLERIDVSQLGVEHEPLRSQPAAARRDAAEPAAGGAARDPRAAAAADDAGGIDVLMLYSPAARARAGGVAQIEAIAAQVISDTNTAFARSNVAARVRLAGVSEIPFAESAQMGSDLPAVRHSAEAQALRESTRADLVQLLVSSPDFASCGIGYLLSYETPDFDAYSVADVTCVPQYTPTHELAHNMGAHHAPEDGASGALFPYSYGLKDPARGFRTIMAYPCAFAVCGRILNFSNPRVEYDGSPTGSPSQDNARTISQVANYVANFRASSASDQPPNQPTGLRSTITGNLVTVSWNPVASSTYVLQAGTSPGASNLFNASVGAATSASGVLTSGLYFWRVLAVNGAGASPPSLESQFEVTCAPPSPPGALTVALNGSVVTLSWSPSANNALPVTYLLEAGSVPAAANLLVSALGGQTTLTTPAPPGTYYVRVRAQNVCGSSAPSNEQRIVVP